MNDDKFIKEIFKGIEEDVTIDLVDKVMIEVEQSQDHSLLTRRYEKFSKIGMWVTLLLTCILTYLYMRPVFERSIDQEPNAIENILPTLFSLIVLTVLYVQVEIFKSSRSGK